MPLVFAIGIKSFQRHAVFIELRDGIDQNLHQTWQSDEFEQSIQSPRGMINVQSFQQARKGRLWLMGDYRLGESSAPSVN